MSDAMTVLEQNLSALSEKDQAFAQSLLSAAWPSDKQMYWIEQLALRAVTPKAPPAMTPDVDLSTIVQLFQNRLAAGGKKWPELMFGTTDQNTVRMAIAGQKARFPGSINVTSPEKDYDARTWYGRIHTDGKLELVSKLDPALKASITEALVAFAANPASEATAFGVRTGSCCFCATELTHKNSIALGYGPICADKWGLFHTYAKADLKCEGA